MHARKSTCVPLAADTHAMLQYQKNIKKKEKKRRLQHVAWLQSCHCRFCCYVYFWLLLFPHRLLQLSYMVQQLGLRLFYVGCKWNISTLPNIFALKLLVPPPYSIFLLIYAYFVFTGTQTTFITNMSWILPFHMLHVGSSNIYGVLFSRASVIAGNGGITRAKGTSSKKNQEISET